MELPWRCNYNGIDSFIVKQPFVSIQTAGIFFWGWFTFLGYIVAANFQGSLLGVAYRNDLYIIAKYAFLNMAHATGANAYVA